MKGDPRFNRLKLGITKAFGLGLVGTNVIRDGYGYSPSYLPLKALVTVEAVIMLTR